MIGSPVPFLVIWDRIGTELGQNWDRTIKNAYRTIKNAYRTRKNGYSVPGLGSCTNSWDRTIFTKECLQNQTELGQNRDRMLP